MTGYDEFIAVFGKITLFDIAQLLFAGVFLFLAYRKLKKYLVDKHDREQLRDAQLKEALDSVRKYPEYRQQSIRKMEEDAKRRERSKLRDLLLQSYRYYTDQERNPLGAWTSMEAEAFWELFKEYEDAGGNGYIHTVVQPAMNLLKVIDIEDAASVLHLTDSRK